MNNYEQYMKETGAKNSDDPMVPWSKVKVPVWIITKKLIADVQKLVDYWRNTDGRSINRLEQQPVRI